MLQPVWEGLQKLPLWGLLAVGVLALAAVCLGLFALWRFLFGKPGSDQAAASGLLSFLNEMGPQGKVALAGTLVSVGGLWGFAHEQGHLEGVFRLGFVIMFDLLELTLFGMLYTKSTGTTGWTRNLKAMHYTAWALVFFSAWANAVHSPSLAAAPFMALMPIAAAWVVELELRNRMTANGDAEEEVLAKGQAGPVRFIVMLWRTRWAETFANLGVDPNGKDVDLVRAVSAKRAARQLFLLRQMLEATAKSTKEKGEQKRAGRRDAAKLAQQLTEQREKTNKSLDRADFGTNSSQALAVMRGLAGWTRTDDLAVVPTENSELVTKIMEEVAIMPAARRLQAAAHEAEAVAARQEAESARQDAKRARLEAENARTEAEAAKAKAAEAVDLAEKKAAELAAAAVESGRARKDVERARTELASARLKFETEIGELTDKSATLRQQAEKAAELVTEAEEKKQKLEAAGLTAAEQKDQLEEEIRDAATRLAGLETELQTTLDSRAAAEDKAEVAAAEARRLEEKLAELQSAVQKENAELTAHGKRRAEAEDSARQAAEVARRAASRTETLERQLVEAEQVLIDLREGVWEGLSADMRDGRVPSDGIFFRNSEPKQKAWEEYLYAVTSNLPTATARDLAEQFSISESNARNWRLHFMRARQLMIANEAPSAAERNASDAERGPDSAERTSDTA
ncbi:hypothetical protein ACIRPK_34150 [Kitasatospora sp. NPDC101801]|uniref:hypothetical protein n=1 Tax=Kitasatospora sp. NPDC101801 TaxID=3364103 RepID=UPI00382B02AC